MSSEKDMKGEHTVTFKVPAGTLFDLQHKKKVLTAFASLPMEDIERLEQLIKSPDTLKAAAAFSKLSSEDRQRIEQLIESPKALAALKQYWNMLKAMFK